MSQRRALLLALGLCACAAQGSPQPGDRSGKLHSTARLANAGSMRAAPKRATRGDAGKTPDDAVLLVLGRGSDMEDADAGEWSCDAGSFCPATQPDPDDCGKLTLQAEPKVVDTPGNVLLIFDRSGSMGDQWNGVPKWEAAGDAVIKALQPLAEKLSIGAVLFPSPEPDCDPNAGDCGQHDVQRHGRDEASCNVNAINALDELDFTTGVHALNELETGNAGAPKYRPQPSGRTPTSEAVARADAALRAAKLKGTTAVVLITDGEPNCNWDQAQSSATLMDWAASLSVKTHVIGLPGAADGGGPAVLTALARAGQTGDYITPSDAQALQTRLADISSHTVTAGFDSCEITLSPAAKVPDKLHLLVTTQGHEQDVPHVFAGQTEPAWKVSSDGVSVQLMGNLCENVKAGTYESITFVFGCVDVPPLPPPVRPSSPS